MTEAYIFFFYFNFFFWGGGKLNGLHPPSQKKKRRKMQLQFKKVCPTTQGPHCTPTSLLSPLPIPPNANQLILCIFWAQHKQGDRSACSPQFPIFFNTNIAYQMALFTVIFSTSHGGISPSDHPHVNWINSHWVGPPLNRSLDLHLENDDYIYHKNSCLS